MDEHVFDPTYGGTLPVGKGPGDENVFDPTYGGTLPPVSTAPSSSFDWSKVGDWAKSFLTGKGSVADYGTAIAGLMGLYEYMNRDRSPKSWEGKVQKGTYVPPTVSPSYYQGIMGRGYGQRAMGANPFTGGRYIAPPASATPPATKQPDEVYYTLPVLANLNPDDSPKGLTPNNTVPAGFVEKPTPVAASSTTYSNSYVGGKGGWPIISDIYFAKGGAMPPRYLRGETDGMADQLPSSIDGRQPAKLSHGEFVVPADVVSHLGNGNSDAGAKVLYKMMDRVRQARTGTKRQGKQIKPEKFMPGGIANIPRYSGGGAVAFETGGNVTAGTTAGGLAPWVGDYIAGPEGFLSKAWALGDQPYQAYEGPLTAGISPTQQLGITAAQTLGTPSQFGTATSLAERAGQAAGNISYTPGTFGTQGVTATGVTSGYQAPGAYQAGTFTSGFNAPGAYQAGTFDTGYTAGKFDTGLGPVKSVQEYMSPYMTGVTDVEAREARRQADISRQTEQARLAQAGAYGGSRQAIMEAERQRNLGQQIGDITSKGLQSAYDRAMQQRLQESQLGLQAQQYGEQAKQFGATTGLQAQQAREQSRQFGAQQALSAAQLQAQFGLDAQKAQELSRQFGYGQQMTAAQLQAQFGLDAQKANQIANLQAQQSNQRAALEAQQMGEQSRQFGANLGLQGIGQQLSAAQTLGGLGQQQFGTQLQGIDALMKAGATEQQAEQAAVDAQIKQFQEAQQWPYKQLEFQRSLLQGLPVGTQTVTPTTSGFSDLVGGIGQLLALYKDIKTAGG